MWIAVQVPAVKSVICSFDLSVGADDQQQSMDSMCLSAPAHVCQTHVTLTDV